MYVMIILVLYNHLRKYDSYYLVTFRKLLYTVLVLTFLYSFIQLNFNLVSHNFGIKISQFVNSIQCFMFTIVVLIVIFTYYTFVTFGSNTSDRLIVTDTKLKYPHNLIITTCIALVLVTEVIYSFVPLINDFL